MNWVLNSSPTFALSGVLAWIAWLLRGRANEYQARVEKVENKNVDVSQQTTRIDERVTKAEGDILILDKRNTEAKYEAKSDISELRFEMKEMKNELRADMNELKAEMNEIKHDLELKIVTTKNELEAKIVSFRDELKSHIDTKVSDLKSHFDETLLRLVTQLAANKKSQE